MTKKLIAFLLCIVLMSQSAVSIFAAGSGIEKYALTATAENITSAVENLESSTIQSQAESYLEENSNERKPNEAALSKDTSDDVDEEGKLKHPLISATITEKDKKEFSGYAKTDMAYLEDAERDAFIGELTALNEKAVSEEKENIKTYRSVLPLELDITEEIPDKYKEDISKEDIIHLDDIEEKHTYIVNIKMEDASALEGTKLLHRKDEEQEKPEDLSEDGSPWEELEYKLTVYTKEEKEKYKEENEKDLLDEVEFETTSFSPFIFFDIEETQPPKQEVSVPEDGGGGDKCCKYHAPKRRKQHDGENIGSDKRYRRRAAASRR